MYFFDCTMGWCCPLCWQVLLSLQELLKAAQARAGMDSSSGPLPAASAIASLSNSNFMQQQQQQQQSSGGALQNDVHQKLRKDQRPSSEQQQQTEEAVSRGILTTPQLAKTSTSPGPSRPCRPAAVDPGPGVMPAAVDLGPGVMPAAADGRPDEALGGPLQQQRQPGGNRVNGATTSTAAAAGSVINTVTGNLSPLDKAAWDQFVLDL
jgi:hypothetical protein